MQLFGTKGQKFLHCPWTKGHPDKLKILPRDGTARTVCQNRGWDGTQKGMSQTGQILTGNQTMYHISANSFRGNYSFLNLTLCSMTFDHSTYRCGNYSREEIIQGRKLYGIFDLSHCVTLRGTANRKEGGKKSKCRPRKKSIFLEDLVSSHLKSLTFFLVP